MPITATNFPGLFVFEPKIWEDQRGYFYESYNQKLFSEAGITTKFVQDNQAQSVYGVIRGLHYQKGEYSQVKLIRALTGVIVDVAVDIRKGSPTFGKAFTIELSAENKKQLYIPKGFAHGYSVISATAEVFYKCDEYYNKAAEGGISFNDSSLGINWQVPMEKAIISDKDLLYKKLAETETAFHYRSE